MKYYEKLTMTGEEVKRKLREQGITLKEWANARGYPYYLVSRVICGTIRAISDSRTRLLSNWE